MAHDHHPNAAWPAWAPGAKVEGTTTAGERPATTRKDTDMECTPFPIGAWVRDTFGTRMGASIARRNGAVRFNATAGEIISIGKIAGALAYRIKFAEAESIVLVANCECYQCGAADDETHAPFCADKSLRSLPHEPGYAADVA